MLLLQLAPLRRMWRERLSRKWVRKWACSCKSAWAAWVCPCSARGGRRWPPAHSHTLLTCSWWTGLHGTPLRPGSTFAATPSAGGQSRGGMSSGAAACVGELCPSFKDPRFPSLGSSIAGGLLLLGPSIGQLLPVLTTVVWRKSSFRYPR